MSCVGSTYFGGLLLNVFDVMPSTDDADLLASLRAVLDKLASQSHTTSPQLLEELHLWLQHVLVGALEEGGPDQPGLHLLLYLRGCDACSRLTGSSDRCCGLPRKQISGKGSEEYPFHQVVTFPRP